MRSFAFVGVLTALVLFQVLSNCDANSVLLENFIKGLFKFDKELCQEKGTPLNLNSLSACVDGPQLYQNVGDGEPGEVKNWTDIFNPLIKDCNESWPQDRTCFINLYKEVAKCYETDADLGAHLTVMSAYPAFRDYICSDSAEIGRIMESGAWKCADEKKAEIPTRFLTCITSKSVEVLQKCFSDMADICDEERTRNDLKLLVQGFGMTYDHLRQHSYQQNSTSSASHLHLLLGYVISLSVSLWCYISFQTIA